MSKVSMVNHSKEKLVSQDNDVQFKRPDTATLERPSILDPSYLRKLDMSIISREKLMNIKNLLAKPHRDQYDNKSNTSSYDSILSDMNNSDESITSKLSTSDCDTIKKNKKNEKQMSKTNKKKNQKTNKNNNEKPTKRNGDSNEDVSKKTKDDFSKKNNEENGEIFDWEEQDYQASKAIINRTYRIKHNRRQSIINSSAETSRDDTSVTVEPVRPELTRRVSSCQKLDAQPIPDIPLELKKDKKCKKSDENINKSHPKLIVKKNMAMNKFSKKSLENLALKKSKSKEKINVKNTDKVKKGTTNAQGKDKIAKENGKELSVTKEPISNSKPTVIDNRKEKLEKVKYETMPRQKKNSEPSPSKQRPPLHRRSISEVSKIELDSKENTTPKKKFLKKNSRESNSPNVVRKFMDPITGKLRTVDEIPTAVKKIKDSSLKVPGKGDDKRGSRGNSSTENSPRKTSISSPVKPDIKSNNLSTNCDSISPRKSVDGYPARKSSLESYTKRKASLNIDSTSMKSNKLENGVSERRRSYYGQTGDIPFTQLIPGEKYEDLFKKSDMIPRDDPISSDASAIQSPIQANLIQEEEDVLPTFNVNRSTNGRFITDASGEPCDNLTRKDQPAAAPTNYFTNYFTNSTNSADLFHEPEFRSLLVTPTFMTDESWTNSTRLGHCTGSLKKYKTIECNLCSKQFGAASFTFHEPHCRQRWLRENSDRPSTPRNVFGKCETEDPNRDIQDTTNSPSPRSDILCVRCNNKIPSPLVDIHEEHCRKLNPSPFSDTSSSPSPTMSPSRKPRTVICYLCGREFGKTSIRIHEPQCLKKWHIENDKLPNNLKRPEPTRPEVIHVPGTDKIDTQAMGEAAFKSYVAQLVPCGKCGRKFFPDRVEVHENVCKGLETRK
uniref:Zinc finger protein 474 n=1 Tax=Cacopsylla melanoneura TaxID=428564 RepID=A0A8D8LRL0_9HEMI